MTFALKLSKRLFPNAILTHHISDLDKYLSTRIDKKTYIYISIEKENKCRQFCSLTMEQLTIFFQSCPITERALYESIPPTRFVKAYIDFEYPLNNNLDIQNHHIGPTCCLKILHYLLNNSDDIINTTEVHTENILKQFLVLTASTTEKISYHFIHANPSVLFENIATLGIFIKGIVHFLLLLIARHKCQIINIDVPIDQSSMTHLIELIAPYVTTLRKHCTYCRSSIPHVSIADIAYLLVRNKTNKWTVAIDMNVYSKNQQFRLFNSVKYGKNNPLIPCDTFPFDLQSRSDTDFLQKSLITFIEDDQIPKIYFKDEKFLSTSLLISTSNSITTIAQNHININLINEHIGHLHFLKTNTDIRTNQNISHSLNTHCINHVDLSKQDIQIFIHFVENIIKSDSSHQGHIHSCLRGTHNKNLLFFNITGKYRYCPKKKGHHQRNSVAIIINTRSNTYSIRCKDKECDNTILIWKKIQ